jgi:Protein of unknown function (DUF3050)
MKLPLTKIKHQQEILENHPLLNDNIIKDITGIQIFMESHVFAVWDFMSLIKSLQHHVCPSTTCWVPTQKIRSGTARLINEIILSEETDIDADGVSSISHHDLYCQAMLEVGADAKMIESWVDNVAIQGYRGAAETCEVPTPSLKFMNATFGFIETNRPHIIAGAFCFGRETIIPRMFTRLADQLNITRADCPKFHYYLDRHIQIDGEEHGPASLAMVEDLCDHDPVKIHEAEQAALAAIRARITLWDDLKKIIENKDHRYYKSDC